MHKKRAFVLGIKRPLCVFLFLFLISPLSLSLPYSSLASIGANSSGSKKCYHFHPKSVGCSKLPNFDYSLIELGRKARRVHLPTCGLHCLKESAIAIGRGGSPTSALHGFSFDMYPCTMQRVT